MIKLLKIGNSVYEKIPLQVNKAVEKEVDVKVLETDENGKEIYTTKKQVVTEYVETKNELIPTDLEEFKAMAIDTINWVVGDNIKKALSNQQTLLSASNSKAIALLAKVVATLNPDVSGLTALEKSAYDSIQNLAANGYADSELLNASLASTDSEIAKASDKVTRITNATTIDEVIAVLNEV